MLKALYSVYIISAAFHFRYSILQQPHLIPTKYVQNINTCSASTSSVALICRRSLSMTVMNNW